MRFNYSVSDFYHLAIKATAIGYRRVTLEDGKIAYRGEYGGFVIDLNCCGVVSFRASTSARFALGIY